MFFSLAAKIAAATEKKKPMSTTMQLSENSHQGFEGLKAALCLASMDAKSNNASGMQACLRQEGIGSRCSGKERDETGLDYFGARYFSGAMGRFTSPDPLLSSGRPSEPQSWNRYAYVLGNPIKFNDPTGLYEFADCSDDSDCEENKSKFKKAISNAKEAVASKMLSAEESSTLAAVLNYLGDVGKDKGRGTIVFGSLSGSSGAAYLGNETMQFDMGKLENFSKRKDMGQGTSFTIVLAGSIAHEGSHSLDDFNGNMPAGVNMNNPAPGLAGYEATERRAYNAESYVYKGHNSTYPARLSLWRTNWGTEGLSKVDQEVLRSIGVEAGVKGSMDDIKKQIGIQ